MNFKIQNLKLKIFLLVIIFGGIFGLAKNSHAADFYVTQNTSGSDSGADCTNAHSAVWFNLSGNWANPKEVDKIGPGDMVHLCGILTSPLTVQGSGTSGSSITILFESGAKISAPTWYGANNDAAIYGDGTNYITIDGGNNGLIEATDNGTEKTYQYDISGIRMHTITNLIVKNLSIYPMYDRVEGGDAQSGGKSIHIEGTSSNLTFQNNRIGDAGAGVYIACNDGEQNIFIDGNTCDNTSVCALVGTSNANQTVTNVQIFNNTFHKSRKWSGNPSIHTELIHPWAVQSGTRMDGLKVYNNKFYGQCGTNSTALAYIEGAIYSPQIYNNLFLKEVDESGACGDGGLALSGCPHALVANNTFAGEVGTNGLGVEISLWATNTGKTIENNLFYNVAAPVVTVNNDGTDIATCDYNVYYGGTIFVLGEWSQYDFNGWKAKNLEYGVTVDAHSTLNQPIVDANYIPLSGDSITRDHGVSLSTYFTNDKIGISRPQGSAWDIGAYEYVSGEGDTISPGAPSGLSVD